MSTKVGIVGFGNLGKYLYNELKGRPDYEVLFVWNRTRSRMEGLVPDSLVIEDLTKCGERNPDLIVEVADPVITKEYGPMFVEMADYMIGSPTGLSDPGVLQAVSSAATSHGVYIAVGALWGSQDIKRMADRGTLMGLKVTMKKHPSMIKAVGELAVKNQQVTDQAVVLYEGSVRGLCPLAPNNVNTMATAAIIAHNLGFDGVIGCLVSDPSLDCHVVEVEVQGPAAAPSSSGGTSSGTDRFSVHSVRVNPAPRGGVTGKQTYTSFWSSLLAAKGSGPGIHVC